MNEKQVILDFLKWFCDDDLPERTEINYACKIDEYLSSKEPKTEEHQDWFLHTHWKQNIA